MLDSTFITIKCAQIKNSSITSQVPIDISLLKCTIDQFNSFLEGNIAFDNLRIFSFFGKEEYIAYFFSLYNDNKSELYNELNSNPEIYNRILSKKVAVMLRNWNLVFYDNKFYWSNVAIVYYYHKLIREAILSNPKKIILFDLSDHVKARAQINSSIYIPSSIIFVNGINKLAKVTSALTNVPYNIATLDQRKQIIYEIDNFKNPY